MDKTPAFAFIAHLDDPGPGRNAFQQIANNHQIKLILGLNRRLREAGERGIPTQAHPSIGGHWSEEDHAVVADLLYEALAPQARFIAQSRLQSTPATQLQK